MPPADNDAVSFLDDWVSALVRKGHWHGDFLTDAEFEALSARLRRYGLFVRCAHWSDVGVYYEAAAPGIDSMTAFLTGQPSCPTSRMPSQMARRSR